MIRYDTLEIFGILLELHLGFSHDTELKIKMRNSAELACRQTRRSAFYII